MLAEELTCHFVYLFCRFSSYIACLLALLVVTESGGYMTRQVVKLMHKGIEELSRRGCTAYNQYALTFAGIAQPGIEIAGGKVVIGTFKALVIRSSLGKCAHYFLYLIVSYGVVARHFPPMRPFKIYGLAYHSQSSQSAPMPFASRSTRK